MKVYLCKNKGCVLGIPGQPGRFTDGITQQRAIDLTADPDAKYGEGYCPNCGHKGTATKETHKSVEGDDPHAALHRKVAERVREGDVDLADAQAELVKEADGG